MDGLALLVDANPTVRRVLVSMLQKLGYESLVASGEEQAMEVVRSSKEPFAFVLLDATTLSLHWREFARKLHQHPRHRASPLLLMSPSSEVLARCEGAIPLQKPFFGEALQATIREALLRSKEPVSQRAPGSGRIPVSKPTLTSIPTVGKVVPESVPPPSLEPARLALLARAMLEQLGSRGWYKLDELEKAAEQVLTQPIEGLSEVQLSNQGGPREVLRGISDAVPLGEVMQVLQMQMQTGVLEVYQSQGVDIKIFFRGGLIDLVTSQGASEEFRMGRYLLEEGLLTSDALAEAIETSRSMGRLLGDILMEQAVITQEQLSDALTRQSSELIYEVLRWKDARYKFFREKSAPKNLDAQLGLPVASLVMEGFRRVDEWRIIEESLPFEVVLLRDETAIDRMGSKRLGRLEQVVLDQVDGQRNIRQILEAATISSFDGSKILFQFLQSRLVRKRTS